MTDTTKGSKGPGHDYGAKRWGNRGGNASPSKRKARASTKELTRRAERRIAKQKGN